ncbi:MAG: hypothetical protein U0414_26585 [Polyangiaceae bacterium]
MASSAPSGSPSVEPSASAAPAPTPDAQLFLAFDTEPSETPEGVKALDDLVAKLASSPTGHVELTGSALSTGDSTNDRSKALRRGEALRNWFIEHKVSGARVVVKNPGPPCEAKAEACQGVHVDVWLGDAHAEPHR